MSLHGAIIFAIGFTTGAACAGIVCGFVALYQLRHIREANKLIRASHPETDEDFRTRILAAHAEQSPTYQDRAQRVRFRMLTVSGHELDEVGQRYGLNRK